MALVRRIGAYLFGLALLSATAGAAQAGILIQIDKPAQTMTVSINGQPTYRWPVSTGATGYSTPAGSYTAFRMEPMHYSREWDNAGMPHSIFFTQRGHAIHGSDHPRLGSPASHGCVRLSLSNAAALYQLVQAYGLSQTKVVVRGSDPPGVHPPTQIPARGQTQTRERRPFFPFFGR
jgi:lipoprotein-anchoring transpeptidase ErfK/SrfK